MNEVTFAGVDLTRRATKWPNLEEVKTVLLGQAAMFTGEIVIDFDNTDGALSPGGSSSLLAGIDWQGKPLVITRDDRRNETIDAANSYDMSNGTAWWNHRSNTSNRQFFQTITPTGGPYDGVYFRIGTIGAPVGYLWCELRNVVAAVPGPVIYATSLKWRTENLAGAAGADTKFEFPGGIHPDGVTQYALVLWSDAPIDAANYIRPWSDLTAPTYAGGQMGRQIADYSWQTSAAWELCFNLFSYDHITMFEGEVENIEAGPKTQTTTITAANLFKVIAETRLVRNDTAVNPAAAILGMLRTVLDDDVLDVASFITAGEHARAAGAGITYRYVEEDSTTIMAAIEAIAELCSLVVYVHDNRMFCQRFRVYQGSEAELKYELTDSIMREWGKHGRDTSSWNNAVTVGYTVDDFVTRSDAESIRKNSVTRTAQFDGTEQLVATDEASAIYFGERYLERAANARDTLSAAGGVELEDVKLGDRFPVSPSALGLSRFPMEAIQVNRKLGTDDVELTLVELVAQ